jgi:hypothetical protein
MQSKAAKRGLCRFVGEDLLSDSSFSGHVRGFRGANFWVTCALLAARALKRQALGQAW